MSSHYKNISNAKLYDQSRLARMEFQRLQCGRTCYLYDDFVDCCQTLVGFQYLQFPIAVYIGILQARLMSYYPKVLKLLGRYIDYAAAIQNGEPVDENSPLVDINSVSMFLFTHNFLNNLKDLHIKFAVPGWVVRRRRHVAKQRELKKQQREESMYFDSVSRNANVEDHFYEDDSTDTENSKSDSQGSMVVVDYEDVDSDSNSLIEVSFTNRSRTLESYATESVTTGSVTDSLSDEESGNEFSEPDDEPGNHPMEY